MFSVFHGGDGETEGKTVNGDDEAMSRIVELEAALYGIQQALNTCAMLKESAEAALALSRSTREGYLIAELASCRRALDAEAASANFHDVRAKKAEAELIEQEKKVIELAERLTKEQARVAELEHWHDECIRQHRGFPETGNMNVPYHLQGQGGGRDSGVSANQRPSADSETAEHARSAAAHPAARNPFDASEKDLDMAFPVAGKKPPARKEGK